ncbi:MAG: SpoIIE family protein phosphatase [Bacteroidetes bacterium]|nr:SpoIIE family protein phosphatase [Bacteroidota bacterium]
MIKIGIFYKLSIAVLTIVLLVFGIILTYNYNISKKLLYKNVEENLIHLANSAVNRIETLTTASMQLPENLARIILKFQPDVPRMKEYLDILVENNPDVFGSCIAFEPYDFYPDSLYMSLYSYRKGDSILFANLGKESYNYFLWDWYQIPKELKQPVWSEPYFDEGGGNIIMSTYSVPILDGNTVKGIVTIDISMDWLRDFVSGIRIFNTGYAFLISGNGSIITHPEQDFIMNESIFSLAEEYNLPELRDIGRSMIKGESNFVSYTPPDTKTPGFLYYTPLTSTGWSLGIVIPENELMADLHRLHRALLSIGIIGIFLLIISILFISSRITNPLRKLARISTEIGKGNLNVDLPVRKSKDEIASLNDSFRTMQTALKQYIENLKETTAAKEKIESEIKIARDIQQGILPKIFPPFPDREDVDLFAFLEPAREVGGDLYDFFFIDNENLCFAIGDVSGKGIPSSLLMAITRTLLRAKVVSLIDPNVIVSQMNRELCRDNDNAMFVTFFLGILNLPTGNLSYCNAGHNFPLLRKQNHEIIPLSQTHGTPLGLFEEYQYHMSSLTLDKKDMLILYTDGVSEAFDPNQVLYSEKRIEKIIAGYPSDDPKGLSLNIQEDVKKHSGIAEQSDDITIMVVRYY